MPQLLKGKGPVYKLDRRDKARMISRILEAHLGVSVADQKILDIGCGNGDIAAFFAMQNEVSGVDIVDRVKPQNAKFAFHLTPSEHLPFSDRTFDVVLSHHVIEHVNDQRLHLREMARVLKNGGVAYLATPNRTSPLMQGHVGNQMVLRHHQMRPMFQAAGFDVVEFSVRILKHPNDFGSEFRRFRHLPKPVLKLLRPLFPSHVFVLPLRGVGG